MTTIRQRALTSVLLSIATLAGAADLEVAVDWPAFMQRHDLVWDKLPRRWEEAPYLGNGNIGSMLYLDEKKNTLRLQLFRLDVQDHRDDTYGWTAYSRPRFMLGSFYLQPVGKITGGAWRMDLWNATLRGTIETDQGEIRFAHLVHTHDMVVMTTLDTTAGEGDCRWSWAPGKAETTRPGYPRNEKERQAFAGRYGDHFMETLKPFTPNPEVKLAARGKTQVSIQDLLAGGQYAVAWTEDRPSATTRRLVVSIENTFPDATAADRAVANVERVAAADEKTWIETHERWWHRYYPESFFSIPDTRLESFYWHQMYKMACATRGDRPMMDTAGPWIQPTPWPYITWDLNVQLCYWPVGPSNRLHLGDSLLNVVHKNKQNLIENVLPEEWREDSAYIPVVSAQDLIQPRNGDRRYWDCVGNLPWVMHNCWLLYRFSMDDAILREKIYPLLRRGINLYRHLLVEGDDGKWHLPVTYSPEGGRSRDCNYDLALLRWGCRTLLWSAERLAIDDPLIPVWRDIDARLVDFPTDENGFMLGKDKPWNFSHRHYSHLLMAYPLYLVNREEGPGQSQLIETSLKHWVSFKGALAGYSYTGASSLAAALGQGDESLQYLKGLERFLQPNGLYKESGPVMETPLSAAQSMHDMVIQSWGGTIRVFPAAPAAWPEVRFHHFRAEGAFLVSASRHDGRTRFVRIESLAGEPCRVRPNLPGAVRASGARDFAVREIEPGLYTIDLKKGETVTLWSGDAASALEITPVPADPDRTNSFGLRGRR